MRYRKPDFRAFISYFWIPAISRSHSASLLKAGKGPVYKNLLIASAVLVTLSAAAQPNRELEQSFSILRVAMAENGYLTPQMHREFWEILRNKSTGSEIEAFRASLAPAIVWAQKYQLTLWKSALTSSRRGEIYRSDELKAMQSEMPDKFDEWMTGVSSSVFAQALQAWKTNLKQSLANAEKLLEAAASGSQMDVPEMPPIPITEQYIVRVLDRINGSFSRVKNLVNPDWTAK